MKNLMYLLVIPLVLLVVLACRVAEAPGQPAAPAPATTKAASRPIPSQWEDLAAAARKEGSLLIVGTSLGATKQVVTEAFRQKYGVNIEYIDGRGAEVAAKVLAERKAGLYLVDVGHTGDATFFDEIRPNKITLPLEPFLILPEVLDRSKWRGSGDLPFIDAERQVMAFAALSVPPIIINTDMVGANEITRNADLLNSKWKDKIVLGDPSTPGTGNAWFAHVVTQLHANKEQGLQFMRDLARQEPVITRDYRLVVEWVAKGKYPVGLGHSMAVVSEFKRAGAPLAYAGMADKSHFSPGSGTAYIFDRAPHPNAAKLYVNWILSKEGSELWTRSYGDMASLRLDAANDHMDQALVPAKDINLKREEFIKAMYDSRAWSREVFKDLMR